MCIGRFTLFLTNLRRHGILEQKESTALIGGQIPIRPFVIAQKMPVGNTHLAVSEPLPMAPGHVFRNAPAFFLCQAAHEGDEEFPFTNYFDTNLTMHPLYSINDAPPCTPLTIVKSVCSASRTG